MFISKRYWTEAKTPPKTAAPKEKADLEAEKLKTKKEKIGFFL